MRKLNRKMLYLHTQIARGTPLRKEGEGGGMTPGVAAPSMDLAAALNNAPAAEGNPNPDPGTQAPGGDNAGDKFDPASFWDSPQAPANPAPQGGSAGTPPAPAGTPAAPAAPVDGGNDLATQLATQIGTLNFGGPIFDNEVAAQINNGDFTGVQKRFDSAMQTAVRQSLAMNVQVLRPFAEQLLNQMREEFGGTLNQRDNQSTLVRDFPAAANPAVAPMIQNIYEQALKRTGNKRELAVVETKRMLAFMANTTAGDLGLDVAPQGSGDRRPPAPATKWLDELTGRS